MIAPHRSVRDTARLMDALNVGVLPVCDGQRLVGLLTDQDIVVRSTARGPRALAEPKITIEGGFRL